MFALKVLLTAAVLTSLASLPANSQAVCPPLPNQLSARVDVKTSYDAGARLYTYRYTVGNNASSQQHLKYFVVQAAMPVIGVKSPPHWTPLRFGPDLIGWRVSKEEKPVQHVWGAAGFHGQLKPGESQDGFEFRSPHPPGNVRMFVRGYSERLISMGGAEAEMALDTCPDPTGDFFEFAVESTTLGPVMQAEDERRAAAVTQSRRW